MLDIVNFFRGVVEPDEHEQIMQQFDAMSDKLDFIEAELRAMNMGPLSRLEEKIDKQVEWQHSIQTLENLLRTVDT